MEIQRDRVKLSVGGRIFETTATTLANAGPNSFFGALFDENWDLNSQFNNNSNEALLIDRNPECFSTLLDLLRTGDINIPPNINERLLFREASFYGLLDHVRTAKWGPFDGNRLRQSRSVRNQASDDGTAIRAGPDGGCCVAHGSMVRVYEWMLEEHPPLNLEYRRVNDIGWVDSENVVISVCERLGSKDGGMGLFSASSGELRYRFQVCHDNQVKSYTAGALSFSSDYKIFSSSSCEGSINEYGIGVWDQVTEKQIDFYYESPVCFLGSLGNADKLQWLNGRNCLLDASLFPRNHNSYLSLLDFRDKYMVWSWHDTFANSDEEKVCDAIAMEENNSICVVNQYHELGFIDLRFNRGSQRRHSRRWWMKGSMPGKPRYPKLASHEGQLFSSMNDSISVFCGPYWKLTSRLRRCFGDSICDISIGGDRLFALHSEENVFDIWECPPSPII